MKHLSNLSELELEFTTVLSLTFIGYTFYYFFAFSEKTNEMTLDYLNFKNGPLQQFCFQKIVGFLFMGIFPFLTLSILWGSPLQYGFSEHIGIDTLYWVTGAAVFIIPINFMIAGNPENLKQYPQIRTPTWNNNTFLINFIGWFGYLLAYEFLFRGVLFLGSLSMLGLIPAIALNTVIYALAHLPKGIKETFGSIPVGILVCVITYTTGNIWASFLIHLTMAVSNEVFAFYRHPEMSYDKLTD